MRVAVADPDVRQRAPQHAHAQTHGRHPCFAPQKFWRGVLRPRARAVSRGAGGRVGDRGWRATAGSLDRFGLTEGLAQGWPVTHCSPSATPARTSNGARTNVASWATSGKGTICTFTSMCPRGVRPLLRARWCLPIGGVCGRKSRYCRYCCTTAYGHAPNEPRNRGWGFSRDRKTSMRLCATPSRCPHRARVQWYGCSCLRRGRLASL
jgi:hypothetical protein